MAITANVGALPDGFVASLSDGHSIEAAGLGELAKSVFGVGVAAGDVQFDWRAGQRMLTAGQQAAFAAEMRRLGQIACSSARVQHYEYLLAQRQPELIK